MASFSKSMSLMGCPSRVLIALLSSPRMVPNHTWKSFGGQYLQPKTIFLQLGKVVRSDLSVSRQ